MVYTATGQGKFRLKGGSLSQKLGYEFAAIKAETDSLDVATAAHTTDLSRGLKVAKIYSPGTTMNGFSFNWQNPETSKIIITKAILHVYDPETVGTGALINIGSAIATATEGDNLFDGLTIETEGLYDNVTNAGTNGKPQIVVDENGGTTSWITGKVITATGASYSGYLYLFYVTVLTV